MKVLAVAIQQLWACEYFPIIDLWPETTWRPPPESCETQVYVEDTPTLLISRSYMLSINSYTPNNIFAYLTFDPKWRHAKLITVGLFVASSRFICSVNLKVLSVAIHKLLAFDQIFYHFTWLTFDL